jgi:hypothetical protein
LTLHHTGGFSVGAEVIAMTATDFNQPATRPRLIGAVGTLVRVVVGLLLVGSVAEGHINGPFHPWPWVLGLVGFPAIVVAWQRWRAHRDPSRLVAIGPVGHLVNIAVFFALYLTTWYAPALSVTSDAALLFYGTSMLLAAARGYAGCEVLAISNWLLRRDDQIGCMLFWPVDTAEHADRRAVPPR